VLSSARPIVHPRGGGVRVVGTFDAAAEGARERRTVRISGGRRYFAVLYQDDAGNWGRLAPVVRAAGTRRALRLSVSPRRVTAGRRACFRLRVVSGGRAVRGARLRFAGRSRRTDRRGRARVCARLTRAGRHVARATRSGYRADRAVVRVVRETRFTG
jgi:hypothetical protein